MLITDNDETFIGKTYFTEGMVKTVEKLVQITKFQWHVIIHTNPLLFGNGNF